MWKGNHKGRPWTFVRWPWRWTIPLETQNSQWIIQRRQPDQQQRGEEVFCWSEWKGYWLLFLCSLGMYTVQFIGTYVQLTLLTDASVNGHLELVHVFLYSLYITLIKMYISLRRTLSAGPNVCLRKSWLYCAGDIVMKGELSCHHWLLKKIISSSNVAMI